ncbi:peptide deformylase [Pontibacter sp. G13]|uniref:peptide deformylase n=1 Tax=Pontibacter sp. G13 TaxID=3074898 RepID=UPI00288C30C6|nr:peptide deformylase [Pontibacter sp. G13]WNJ20886.1 peptide deformylase [Pontibacter sp. G13]
MILPIVGFGHPSLRVRAEDITPDYPKLAELIENMFETMYHAHGVGLAAPQVNLPIRIFVADGSPMDGTFEGEEMEGWKKVFINPQIVEENGDLWAYEEGCLSIPDVREMVKRPEEVTLRYMNEEFEEKTETFKGMQARIIQHEYDHLEGVLFTDHISQMRRRMNKGRLNKISKGEINAGYPMKFPRK